MTRRTGLIVLIWAAAWLAVPTTWDTLARGSESTPTSPLRPELALSAEPIVDLEQGWRAPPIASRVQVWWWWLNGNVTKDAITSDLEELKAKGFGGANIIDAGGAEQRGHRQVPHGPDFGTPEWCELFRHALAEADRLGLELGFNIMSGWNLGGPTVTAEHAAKKLAWAETTVVGGKRVEVALPQPATVGDYYRDVAVLGIPLSAGRPRRSRVQVTAGSSQEDYPPALAIDGDPTTFWVSGTTEPEDGPHPERPVLLQFEFVSPISATEFVIHPRDEYGPKRGWLQYADTPRSWRVLARWTAQPTGRTVIRFPRTQAKLFRLVIAESHDPRNPLSPRNVQIAEVEIKDGNRAILPAPFQMARIDNYEQKAYYQYPGHFTATKADHLLEVRPPGEEDAFATMIRSRDVVDLTMNVDGAGRLVWNAPPGEWMILRFGYTLSGSRVSTSSQGWEGWAIDYLSAEAFDQYWQDVMLPILEVAQPYIGRSLQFLHTDSWELGPVNWTPRLRAEFAERRGYELTRYLPALAGYVVDNRDTSNRVLNDFRRTLGDLIADGKYATFRQYSHELGLGTHPESGGPHAAPVDALQCLGRADIPMGEFWARAATHRVQDHERLFTKQAASAAHIYGKRFVMAEAFTSIGPQWEESPRDLKPVFDRVACEGLNLVMWHTSTCSPDEMGKPGQAYFAGTHLNRHVTWWNQAGAFIEYLNRCQFLLQQGLPVSDVLYFYGENVPSFVRLKDEDPAGVVPGYDYDVINAEALLGRTAVVGRQIVLPEQTAYQVLVLPGGNSYGLDVLRHVATLVESGAMVVGPKPSGPLGLGGEQQYEREFRQLADRLWKVGAAQGHAIRDATTVEALRGAGIGPDFVATGRGDESPYIDYLHRRTNDADVYFVVNRRDRWQDTNCSFRISGKQPELWDPVTGETGDADAFWQADGRTTVPLRMPPNGAMFVVFRRDIAETASGSQELNGPRPRSVSEVAGPWTVQFDPRWGGPAETVAFSALSCWTKRAEEGVRYYSGTAAYRVQFDLDGAPHDRLEQHRWWIDLGAVKNVASVRLNGSELGVVWTDPFRVEVTGHLRAAGNELEVEVTNLWPNRLIGDARLPAEQRLTKTNITKFTADSPLLPSGLLGPVRFLSEAPAADAP